MGNGNFVMARIDALKRKLAAREGKPEFSENCEALRAEIARLESGSPLDKFIHENSDKPGEQVL
jgi:hypothetical protein